MQQALLNLLTTCMTDLKATAADLKVPAAAVGDSSFEALLSQAMDEAPIQGTAGSAANVAQVKAPSPLDLLGLLTALLGKEVAASGQTVQATAGSAPLQTTSDDGLKGSGAESLVTSDDWLQGAAVTTVTTMTTMTTGATGATAGRTINEGTATDANVKPGQQLQDLIMGLLALVMTKETAAGVSTGAATGSDSGEEKAAAEQTGVITSAVITTSAKEGEGTGASQRGKASSNSNTSNSTSETENRHLLDTLALLLFAGLEAVKQVPVKESGASGEAESLPPKDVRTGTEIAAVPRLAGGQAVQNAATNSRETVALPGGEPNGLAARLLDAGKDAAPSTGTTAVQAELTLNPASGVSPAGDNSLSLRISVGNAGASGQISRVAETAGSVRDGAAAGAKEAGSASHEGVVTIVKELTPLLFEGKDGNGAHDPASGKENSGAKGGYPITLDEHVPVNNELTQEQQVSGQSGSAGTIERFDRIMEQVGTGTSSHDMTVRLTVGNDESLVLGLKDLGQTVAVEVRGSSQGMINLLQSQRDVIISHLEGKDISANIVIDPNASGTPEKRDRREMRERTSGPRGKAGGGFDGLLEIFA